MNDDTKVPKTRSTGLSRRKWLSGAAGAAVAAVLPSRAPSLVAAPAFIRSRAMADVQLSIGLSGNVRLRPIVEGLVKPEGIDLTVTTSGVTELFWRQLHFAEFDVSEMSNSSYIITVANGDTRFVAIPVFPSRRFFHTEITVREGSGISRPEDLKGRRVGVPEYQQTAALWARFGLEHEFGVTPQDMDWHMERPPESSHGGATGFEPPDGVGFQYIPEGDSIASMLASGRLDAAFPTFRAGDRPGLQGLFPDRLAETERFYRETGFFPFNHCIVIKRDIVEQHPWVAMNLYNAFVEAKDLVHQRTQELAAVYFELGLLPNRQQGIIESDPYLYGVQPNRDLLEAMTRASNEQGLTPRVVGLEELFHPATMDPAAG